MEGTDEALAATVRQLIDLLGVEPYLESAQRTASRVADMYREVFSGTATDAASLLAPLIPLSAQQRQLVALSSVRFFSMCEHHFLPFYGCVDLGYVAGQHIIGIGRLTRLVQALARRPQLQEKLTEQIVRHIESALKPEGVAVHVVARHLCEAMRGAREENQVLHTYSFRGVLETDVAYRSAFLESISKSA